MVNVKGVIDPAESDYIRQTLDDAEAARATVILQVDSRGSFGDEAAMLGTRIRRATVPVVAWVGPTGARAAGGALNLVYASSLVAVSPGAGIGPARPFDLGRSAGNETVDEVEKGLRTLQTLAAGSMADPAGIDRLVEGAVLPARQALDAGAAELVVPTIPDLLRSLDGRMVRTASGSARLITLTSPGRPVDVGFHEIGLFRRLLHAVSTPTAFYVLLIAGLWSIAFELTQPGFGFAGIAGALSLALAAYSLTVIPVAWPGLALLLAGTGSMALDVLIQRVGLLTVAGTGTFLAGSLLAWAGVSDEVDVALWLILMFTAGGFLYFGFALTVALRARERVRSAQVGLVGLTGEARGDIDPEGSVVVKGAVWRARSADGPISKGSRVRVREVDGLILRVDPEPGRP